jgi:hypothetical protein
VAIQPAYNHLLHLVLHAHPAHHLDILQPAQNLMLDLEAGLHAEGGALLDGEGVLVEVLQGAGLGEVDDDVGSALHFKTEGVDDDFARVVGVRNAGAGADA